MESNQEYNFVEDFINPLNLLISKLKTDEANPLCVNDKELKKQAVLKKYVQDINETLEELRNKLEGVQKTIEEGSYEETFESMKKDATESKKFIKTFGPLFSVYTILS